MLTTITVTLPLPASYAALREAIWAQLETDLACLPIYCTFDYHGVAIVPPGTSSTSVEAGDISIDDDNMLVYVDDECIGTTDEMQEYYPLVHLWLTTTHISPTEF